MESSLNFTTWRSVIPFQPRGHRADKESKLLRDAPSFQPLTCERPPYDGFDVWLTVPIILFVEAWG
jgi:hypothetical protein